MGFFIKRHVFSTRGQGLDQNGYVLINHLTRVIDLTISQIGHLVKLANALVNKDIYYIQSIGLTT
jgi:hypothetical protein